MQPRTLDCTVTHSGNAETGLIHKVSCHGQLVAGTAHTLKETVHPLIDMGGKIIVSLAEVSYVDSMGIGCLVGLRSAATAHGNCILEFENLSDRLQELLSFTHLTDIITPRPATHD
jgi:anti-sigma B factor antagonist